MSGWSHCATVLSAAKQPLFILAVALPLLVSCNVPTAKRDFNNAVKSGSNKVDETWDDVNRQLDKTFDKEKNDLIDPVGGLSRDDYRDELQKKSVPLSRAGNTSGSLLPDVSQLMVAPRAPVIAKDKLVTLSVTDDIPLKEVLIELARRADVDIEIDSGIQGGIIFRAKDRPFSEVIERISDLAGLRYSVSNGVLKVERDQPVIVNYRLDFLNLNRSSSSDVSINTKLLGGSSDGSSISSGSTASLKASSDEGDIWEEVKTAVTAILEKYKPEGLSKIGGQRSPNELLADLAPKGAAPGAPASATATVPGGPATVARPAAPSAAAGGGTNVNGGKVADLLKPAVISVNRQAGVMSILATQRQHKAIAEYLESVRASHSAQVLIEAKVVEVQLEDQYRSGINWNFINGNVTPFESRGKFNSFSGDPPTNLLSVVFDPAELLGFDKTSLEATISLVEQFGVTRTLSSPRINAMNNQFAVLTFAENFVFFELDVQEDTRQNNGGNDETSFTVDSQIKTVPIGVVLALQPSISVERNEILLNVRPTLSRVARTVVDPGVAISAQRAGAKDVSSAVPVVEVRELDSILKLKSGQVMVIGGLMSEKHEDTDKGVPGLAEIPYIGRAFKATQQYSRVVETVIFIKATIVSGSDNVSREDKDLYRKFTNDRRPLSF